MPTVFDFSLDWYQFTRSKFYLQSRSQTAVRPWLGGKSVFGPHAQLWICEVTMTIQLDPQRRDIGAFFSRLDGQAGLIRMGDVARHQTWFDRVITLSMANWQDGTGFSDGSAWGAGSLPATVSILTAGNRGDSSITLAGFPVSTNNVLRAGDLLELLPGGIRTACPHLYEVVVGGNSNASGQIGVEIRPRLRTNITASDSVSLRNASSVFRLLDDDQGAQEVSVPIISNLGFSLVEALDQVT